MAATHNNSFQLHLNPLFPCLHSKQFDSLYDLDNPATIQRTHLQVDNPKNQNNSRTTLSLKTITPSFEISFEKDFMNEHASVFRQSYSNFLEFHRTSTFSKASNKEKIQINSLETREELQGSPVASMLDRSKTQLSVEETKQFLNDLAHEERMHEFLKIVVGESQPSDSLKLVLTARKIWLAFVPFQKQCFSVEELMKLSASIVEELTISEDLDLSGNVGSEVDVRVGWVQFLKVFACTLLLTITQYFENPYFNDKTALNPFKRSLFLRTKDLNKGDFIESPLPLKKRK